MAKLKHHLKKSNREYSVLTALIVLGLLMFLWNIKPFINGTGCKFKFNSESENLKSQGACIDGILTSVVHQKKSGRIYTKKYIWGYWGNDIYLYLISEKWQKAIDTSSKIDIDLQDFEYDHIKLLSAKIFKSLDGKIYSVYDYPIDLIHEDNVYGKFGFIDYKPEFIGVD
ncbi:hypothetical protein P4S70_01535 [Enterovibrio sp. Hal110]